MQNFADQLVAARKAAGLTREQLAESVHVARNTISYWEHGRFQPDLETIKLLGQVLQYDFLKAETVTSAEQEAPVSAPPIRKRRGRLLIGLGVLAAVIAVFCLLVIPRLTSQTTADSMPGLDGERYRPADYQITARNDPAKAYLSITTTVERKRTSDETENYSYRFIAREDNGIGFSITRTDTVIFLRDLADPQVTLAEDYQLFDIETDIAPYGTFVHQGGCAADQPRGWVVVGFQIYGVDENGNEETFTAFLPLT